MAKFRKINVSEMDSNYNVLFPYGTLFLDPENRLKISDGFTQGGISLFKYDNAPRTIYPTAGTSSASVSGIIFPNDPAGGSGDAAYLKYYPISGEQMRLELNNQNDSDDEIKLTASGPIKIESNSQGWTFSTSGSITAPGNFITSNGGFYTDNGNYLCLGENHGFIVDVGSDRRVGFMKYEGIEGAIVHQDTHPFRIGRTTVGVDAATNAEFTTEIFVGTTGLVGIHTESPTRELDVFGELNVVGLSYRNGYKENSNEVAGVEIGGDPNVTINAGDADTYYIFPATGYGGNDTYTLNLSYRASRGLRTLVINSSTLCTIALNFGFNVYNIAPMTVEEFIWIAQEGAVKISSHAKV